VTLLPLRNRIIRLGKREDFGALILICETRRGAGAMSATLTSQRERIARLNDLARRAMSVACTAAATVAFRSLPTSDQSRVRELIETYDAFDEDNDPHGERDFGCVYQLGDGRWTTERPRLRDDERERVFWKLDYYDRDLRFGSDDPANPAVTRRVLTIKLADEY
jgi:Protein of unknown function (DUF3768)